MISFKITQEQFDITNKSLSEIFDVEYQYIYTGDQEFHCFHNNRITSWNKGINGKDSHRYGQKFSEESKQKMSLRKKGTPKSKTHILNMSKSLKGRSVVNKGQKGVFSWYNDGKKEYFLNKNHENIHNLQKGRLKP